MTVTANVASYAAFLRARVADEQVGLAIRHTATCDQVMGGPRIRCDCGAQDQHHVEMTGLLLAVDLLTEAATKSADLSVQADIAQALAALAARYANHPEYPAAAEETSEA